MSEIKEKPICEQALIKALNKMFDNDVIVTDYQTTQLHGGTLGDVYLVQGNALTEKGENKSFEIVSKTQKKWERYADPDSWRREYDFYNSDFGLLFSESFCWPICYYTEINEQENEIQIWMEYIDGVSGLDLTIDMYVLAAEELGRFQGRLYKIQTSECIDEKPEFFKTFTNLSVLDYAKKFYLHYRSWHEVYDYIRADECELPKHLCKMLIDIDEREDEIWTRIKKLPVILCHRDFWVTNIFYVESCDHDSGNIRLIDWDTTGWGYLGEDIASLIADEANVDLMVDIYKRCIPAYYKGFSENVDISHITDDCIWELILVLFGYRLVEWYKFAGTPDEKAYHLKTMEKIYDMRIV